MLPFGQGIRAASASPRWPAGSRRRGRRSAPRPAPVAPASVCNAPATRMVKPAFQTRLTSPLALRSEEARSTTETGVPAATASSAAGVAQPRRAAPPPAGLPRPVRRAPPAHRACDQRLLGRRVAQPPAVRRLRRQPRGDPPPQFLGQGRGEVGARGKFSQQMGRHDLRQHPRGARGQTRGAAPAVRASPDGPPSAPPARPASPRGSAPTGWQQGADGRGIGGRRDRVGHRGVQMRAAAPPRGAVPAAGAAATSASSPRWSAAATAGSPAR